MSFRIKVYRYGRGDGHQNRSLVGLIRKTTSPEIYREFYADGLIIKTRPQQMGSRGP
jgi:hypothetical protein